MKKKILISIVFAALLILICATFMQDKIKNSNPTQKNQQVNISSTLYKANKNIDKSKLRAIDEMPAYTKVQQILNDSGELIFKGVLTYGESINKLNDLNFLASDSKIISSERMVNVFIVKCNKPYMNDSNKRISKGYYAWIYDAETGGTLRETGHKTN